jgi:hypothetical protein
VIGSRFSLSGFSFRRFPRLFLFFCLCRGLFRRADTSLYAFSSGPHEKITGVLLSAQHIKNSHNNSLINDMSASQRLTIKPETPHVDGGLGLKLILQTDLR